MKIENENQEVEILEDSITIKTKKTDNHTIEELEQKIINYLYSLKYYDSNDINLLKTLFDYKKEKEVLKTTFSESYRNSLEATGDKLLNVQEKLD